MTNFSINVSTPNNQNYSINFRQRKFTKLNKQENHLLKSNSELNKTKISFREKLKNVLPLRKRYRKDGTLESSSTYYLLFMSKSKETFYKNDGKTRDYTLEYDPLTGQEEKAIFYKNNGKDISHTKTYKVD